MRKSCIAVLFLSVLLCCFITGCAGLLKSEEMDQELERLIEALNEDDADQIFQSLYPGVVTREEFDASYEEVRQLWEKSEDYSKRLMSFNTKKNYNQSGQSLVREAQYFVYTQNQKYTVTLTYVSDDNGEGLYQFNLNVGTIPVLISGGFTTAGENSALQWGLLILSVLSYLFIIVTEIDILRKRPRLFGLWLAAALTFAGLWIEVVPGNFHIGGRVVWFVLSAFKIYSGGMRKFVFVLPVGAIVYWCMRKKLLSQRFKL